MLQAFRPSTLLERDSRTGVFLRILRNCWEYFFDRMPPDECFLCVPLNFEKLFRTSFSLNTSGRLLVARICRGISASIYNNYFTGTFQAFCIWTRSREVAIGKCSFNQNPWKLYMKKLIRSEVARCQPASLRKEKFFHTYSFMNFAFIFSESTTITSSKGV